MDNQCFVDNEDYERLMSQGKREDMERLLEFALAKFKEKGIRKGQIKVVEEYATAINEGIKEEKKPKNNSLIKMKDFLRGKQEKENPIIKKFFFEKSIAFIYGEPASCKSIFLDYLACCVSSGKKFLGQYPTRKIPTLLLSTENHQRTDKKRLKAIFKAISINPTRRSYKNLQFSIIGRNKIGELSDNSYFLSLKRIIKENNIKLLLIDTISPLMSDLNDNLASEIVSLFKERLFTLVDELGISIITTMHSQKTGRDFLGSVKIKASCDSLFKLVRDNDNLNLLCEKNRDGEHNLKMKIGFENKKEVLHKIHLNFLEEYEGKQKVGSKKDKLKKIDSCQEYIIELLSKEELVHTRIKEECEKEGYTESTIKRAISSLYEAEEIRKHHGKTGGYYVP